MAHTPGPWHAANANEPKILHAFVISNDDGFGIIATVNLHRGKDAPSEGESNARLIAAAPDLLAALKAVVAIADRKTVEFDAARAAIAAAEGKQQRHPDPGACLTAGACPDCVEEGDDA